MRILWSEFRSFKKSFLYAIKGLLYCIKNERNMRIHIVVAVNVLFFAILFKLTKLEYIILILTFGLVIFCEIVNTAIETFVNLTSPAYNGLAKIAKDVAAGGVFLMAIVSIFVGLILFGDLKKLICTFCFIVKNPFILFLFFCLIFFGFAFIFKSFEFKLYRKSVKDKDKVKIYKPKKRNKLNL